MYFKSKSSVQIAREIQHFTFRNLSEKQNPLFVGRRDDIEKIENLIVPQAGKAEPTAFCLYGQNGIGRRSIISQISGNLLGLPKKFDVKIEEGQSINELVFIMHDALYPSSSNDNLSERLREFLYLSEAELRLKAEEILNVIVNARELIVFRDEGGLLDNDGYLRPEINKFLDWMASVNGVRAAIVSRRRPSTGVKTDAIPSIRIGPLPSDDISRLLRRRLQQINVNLSDSDVKDIVTYIDGYPPAVNFVVEIARRGEIQRLINSKSQLVDFTASFMVREIDKSGNKLTKHQKTIMYILALYSPLPLQIIARIVGIDAKSLDAELDLLFDIAFVIPHKNMIRLSDPLQNAIIRLSGSEWGSHEELASVIEDYIRNITENNERLSLGRAMFRANSLAGNVNPAYGIALTSDFINVAQELYHDRKYEQSIDFGLLALEQRPENVDVISYLARAYIQLENYENADSYISELRRLGFLRDHFFVEGFKQRRQGEFGKAVVAYERSISEGRRGAAVHRELAQCYLELGEIGKARSSIAKAHESDADNRYVVDLEILLALRAGDRVLAEKRLGTLAIVDRAPFYCHRRSTFHYRFGEFGLAYDFAKQAYELSEEPNFAIISQLIKSEIAEKKFEDASEHLTQAEAFPIKRYFDIRIGLKCKLETARGDFDAAIGIWQRLRDKNRPVHLALKLAALEGKLNIEGLGELESLELSRLRATLSNFDRSDLDSFFGNER